MKGTDDDWHNCALFLIGISFCCCWWWWWWCCVCTRYSALPLLFMPEAHLLPTNPSDRLGMSNVPEASQKRWVLICVEVVRGSKQLRRKACATSRRELGREKSLAIGRTYPVKRRAGMGNVPRHYLLVVATVQSSAEADCGSCVVGRLLVLHHLRELRAEQQMGIPPAACVRGTGMHRLQRIHVHIGFVHQVRERRNPMAGGTRGCRGYRRHQPRASSGRWQPKEGTTVPTAGEVACRLIKTASPSVRSRLPCASGSRYVPSFFATCPAGSDADEAGCARRVLGLKSKVPSLLVPHGAAISLFPASITN